MTTKNDTCFVPSGSVTAGCTCNFDMHTSGATMRSTFNACACTSPTSTVSYTSSTHTIPASPSLTASSTDTGTSIPKHRVPCSASSKRRLINSRCRCRSAVQASAILLRTWRGDREEEGPEDEDEDEDEGVEKAIVSVAVMSARP